MSDLSKCVLTRAASTGPGSTALWMQFCTLKPALELTDPEAHQVVDCLLETIRKVEAVRYHCENLERMIPAELDRLNETSQFSAVAVLDMSTPVEKEFEALLLQGKACLDVLVKLLRPLSGIKLHSYGNSGKKVAKAIRANMKGGHLNRAEALLSLVTNAEDWVNHYIKSPRDTVAHYRSFPSSGFSGLPDAEGKLHHSPPVDSHGRPLQELARSVHDDLVRFCLDFLALSLSIRFRAMLRLALTPEEQRDSDSPYPYCIGVEPPTPEKAI